MSFTTEAVKELDKTYTEAKQTLVEIEKHAQILKSDPFGHTEDLFAEMKHLM